MEVTFAHSTIIVTGGAGFIGGHLVQELMQQNAKVIVIDIINKPQNLVVSQSLKKKVIYESVDIRNKDKLFAVIKKYSPEYIFHLAAVTIVPYAFSNSIETFETNVMGTIHVLEAARMITNLKGIIIASSDKAYGKLQKIHYTENAPLKGDHPYDVSKSCTDLIAQSYFHTYHLPVAVSRFGNVYGEGDMNSSRLVPGIMHAIIKHKTLAIRSDGSYIRDYLYVKDVVDGYLLLAKNIKKTKGQAFNFGSKETLSVKEVIAIVEKALMKRIPYKILNTATNEIPYQSLNYTKAKKTLHWKPTHSLHDVLPNIYDYYQNFLK